MASAQPSPSFSSWLKSQEPLFKRIADDANPIAFSAVPPLWNAEGVPANCDHPGPEFLKHPPLAMIVSYKTPMPQIKPEDKPDFNLFQFNQTDTPAPELKSIDEVLRKSPPLLSTFKKGAPHALRDMREQAGGANSPTMANFTITFRQIDHPSNILEPIIANFFLFDPDKSKRISSTWRFLACPGLESIPREALIPQKVIKESKSMTFPFTQIHPRIELIVSLDRLVLKNGGKTLAKYYQKPNSSNSEAVAADLLACNQSYTSCTFAWDHVPFSKAEFLPVSDAKPYHFAAFQSTPSVCDSFLSAALNAQPASKPECLPFTLDVGVAAYNPASPSARQYFDFPISTNMKYVNELRLQLVNAHFKYPHGFRGRNIFAQIELIDEGKALPVFGGELFYRTRCQYHVENPSYHDDIIIPLPLDLHNEAKLNIKFFHASVKANAKQPYEPSGECVLNLFHEGCFVEDGLHSINIIFDVKDFVPSDENLAKVETTVNSMIYSCDKGVNAVLRGDFSNATFPKIEDLLPHLYSVLDKLFLSIQNKDYTAFIALLEVLNLFQNKRDAAPSQPLLFYIKFCALREERLVGFHEALIPMWRKYIEEAEFKPKRSDLFCCWFFLEVITKSYLVSAKFKCPQNDEVDENLKNLLNSLTKLLTNFRENGLEIGHAMNEQLCYFAKDMLMIGKTSISVALQRSLFNAYTIGVDSSKESYDRRCFRDFLTSFFSPYTFLFSIYHENGPSLFEQFITPFIESGIREEEHTNSVFKILFSICIQFSIAEHGVVAQLLSSLLDALGNVSKYLAVYTFRNFSIFPYCFSHFLLYYSANKELSVAASKLFSHLLEIDVSRKEESAMRQSVTTESMAIAITRGIDFRVQRSGQTNLGSLRRNFLRKKTVGKDDEEFDEESTFEALAFCNQSLVIKYIDSYDSIAVINQLITKVFNVPLALPLQSLFYQSAVNFAKRNSTLFFTNHASNLKHQIHKVFLNLNEQNLKYVIDLFRIEKESLGSENRMKALTARALYKAPPDERAVELCKGSLLEEKVSGLHEAELLIHDKELQDSFPEVYADACFKRAQLISDSPDARVDALITLANHHIKSGYFSEAVQAQLSAAALVSEYLIALGKIPKGVFNNPHPANNFLDPCPSSRAEICPDSILREISTMAIPGFCTSKYFTEIGLFFIVLSAMEICKRGTLFELSTRVHSLVGPIAEYRHLWTVLNKQFTSSSHAWDVISHMATSNDRMLGNYYRVQFPDNKVFIYRETKITNLWEVNEVLKKTHQRDANGKKVVVYNDGYSLADIKTSPDTYNIHVKSVNPYFSETERQNRVTVFEQNHNVSQFYFDMPFCKSGQKSIETCWLKRTIFTLPHPMPYIVMRVEIPPENIQTIDFSPIENCIQNILKQVSQINESCAMRRFNQLQPLLQGGLLTQVNEGPQKMAEVFLSRGSESVHMDALRDAFRKFLVANAEGVRIHAEYASKNPVYQVLQEELELGLNKLTSTLQPYLK